MTLDETLLSKLNKWKPAGDGRQMLAIPDEGSGWSATVSADRCDDLSVAAWELTLRRTAGAVPDLRAWADCVATRVTGLLEPLRVVEVDPARSEAQLRSHKPTQRGDQRAYYEVMLTGGGDATLRRYQVAEGTGLHREQVAFALTHEALAKAAADIAGA
jgi:hypothetical protein